MARGVKAREATVLSKKPFLPIGRHVQMFRLLLKTIFDRKQHAQGLRNHFAVVVDVLFNISLFRTLLSGLDSVRNFILGGQFKNLVVKF